MTDVFDDDKRSWIMGRVKGKDTKPELLVRSLVHRMGFRFRLHRTDLPGKPDIVLPRHRKIIFINGCFWHGHKNCPRSKRPETNLDFWNAKIEGNIKRDTRIRRQLSKSGWKVCTVWECETRKSDILQKKVKRFLNDGTQ